MTLTVVSGPILGFDSLQVCMADRIRPDSPVPISVQLREILLKKIALGQHKAGSRFPSERELAHKFAVSRASVRETIGSLISAGVLFRTVGRGTFVAEASAHSASSQIAFIISDEIFHFVQSGYDRILKGVEEACRQGGDLLVFRSVASNGDVVSGTEAAAPSGYVVVGGIRRALLDRLLASTTPVVFVDLLIPKTSDLVQAVNIDYAGGTRLAVEKLAQLGHKQIGFIGFAASEKYEAFWQSLSSLELPYDPRQVEFLDSIDIEPGLLAGFRATQTIISRGHLPTAIVATNDYVARGALEALGIAGISVPSQMSVIGFDDLGVAATPALTTVRVDLELVGRLAYASLKRQVQSPGSPLKPLVVPVELVERATTASVK